MQLIEAAHIYESCRSFMNSEKIRKLGPEDIQNVEALMQRLSAGLHKQYGEGPISKKARSKKKTYEPVNTLNEARAAAIQDWLETRLNEGAQEPTQVDIPALHLTPPTESWLAKATATPPLAATA